MDDEVYTTEDAQLEKIVANLETINESINLQNGGDE